MRRACLLACLLWGCGGAEIIAPSPLLVLSTYPGNGALVPAGPTQVAISFSEPVLESSLATAVSVEERTSAGAPVREIAISSVEYNQENTTALYNFEALEPDTAYSVSLKASALEASSGARLPADLIYRFRTAN